MKTVTTVEVRSRGTHTPRLLANNTTPATELAQTLGSDMNDKKEDEALRKQPVGRAPFAARQEVANQLEKME